MLSSNLATDNEPMANPQQPTSAEIGRQVKRVKVAMQLEDIQDVDVVNAETVGERSIRAGSMILQGVLGEAAGGQAPETLVAAMLLAIQQACAPGGAIQGAITQACAPGGVIRGAIQGGISQACAPGGVISGAIQGAITQACEPNGAIGSRLSKWVTLRF
jgi:hypothetical protein